MVVMHYGIQGASLLRWYNHLEVFLHYITKHRIDHRTGGFLHHTYINCTWKKGVKHVTICTRYIQSLLWVGTASILTNSTIASFAILNTSSVCISMVVTKTVTLFNQESKITLKSLHASMFNVLHRNFVKLLAKTCSGSSPFKRTDIYCYCAVPLRFPSGIQKKQGRKSS